MSNKLFDELVGDHNTIKDLLEKIIDPSETSLKSRSKFFQQLKEELVPHMKSEEIAYYPVLNAKRESHEKALESLEEHHVAELVLAELDKVNPDEDIWKAKATVLYEILNHHIDEEEDVIFDLTEELLDDTKINNIYKNFMEEKNGIKKRLAA